MTRAISRKAAMAGALTLCCALGSLATAPAFADPPGNHGVNDRGNRGRHAPPPRRRVVPRRDYGYDYRTYGGYPPPIVYAPPPPGIGLNIVIPLRFR